MVSLLQERLSEREALVAQLEVDGHLTDPLVEEAMLTVPRHLFVPQELQEHAYLDRPLPVGHEQTISAPHMVAMMSAALLLERGDRVLEIGGGQGYHAAILKSIVGSEGSVTSVEYHDELAAMARSHHKQLGLKIDTITGDGANGWADGAPYDAILIACAVAAVPEPFWDQLADDGHVVAPIGLPDSMLSVLRKRDEQWEETELGPGAFVPAQGRLGLTDP